MALTSTIYTFAIDLADADRGIYEHLDLRVPRHPSESDDYLMTRVLAYCLDRLEALELYRVERALIDGLVAALDRRTAWALSVHDRELFVALGDRTVEGRVVRVPVVPA